MGNKNLISTKNSVECPQCLEISSLNDWNNGTKERCTSRDMRRSFTELTSVKAYSRNKKCYYLCPKCNSWVPGNTLTVYSENGDRVWNLGGDRNIKIDN